MSEGMFSDIMAYIISLLSYFFIVLTLLLLNTTCPVLANSVDPNQLASEEAY